MSDNRTTELRERLTERGVKYDGRLLYETEWTVNGITWHAKEYDGMLDVYVRNNDFMLTPEQAITATLGSDREKVLEQILRDWRACDPKCTNRSCGDCEHDEDDGCGLYRRMCELGVIS